MICLGLVPSMPIVWIDSPRDCRLIDVPIGNARLPAGKLRVGKPFECRDRGERGA